jgi:hypothetical protein
MAETAAVVAAALNGGRGHAENPGVPYTISPANRDRASRCS